MRSTATRWFVWLMLFLSASRVSAGVVQHVRIVLPPQADAVVERIAQVFSRQVAQRCNARPSTAGEAPLRVELAIEPGIGAEGFTIADGPEGVIRILGNDRRGLLYGVGKFLRTSRYDQGGFTAGVWRGTSVPEMEVRGIYFATHFHNFYHVAPVEDVQRYVEDLGLWGYNTLMVWYDMHHFNGFDDPETVEFRQRLHQILGAAKSVGLQTALVLVANEGYANSPQDLRADVGGMRGARFHSDICPSQPGGQQYLLANFTRLFDSFADLLPEYVCIWPYDSGGCGCKECQPWGSSGFMKTAEPIARLAKKKFPGVKTVLSTWFFTAEEWESLSKAFTKKPDWVDYVLGEYLTGLDYKLPLQAGVPGHLPMVGFPEISMWGMLPWGGFGANPLPQRLQDMWRPRAGHLAGGFPYSEGIYEDINKALCGQFYWKPDQPADETLKEYIAFEYSPEVVDDVLAAIHILEKNHLRDRIGESAIQACEVMEKAEARLTPQARGAWRWRVLYLRALIDREMHRSKGELQGETLKQAFDELTEIYHAQNALDAVRPPRMP